jgi:hypothetical protein
MCTRADRQDSGSQAGQPVAGRGGGVVVSNEIELVLDVAAILDADLERTGAIEYYRGE